MHIRWRWLCRITFIVAVTSLGAAVVGKVSEAWWIAALELVVIWALLRRLSEDEDPEDYDDRWL